MDYFEKLPIMNRFTNKIKIIIKRTIPRNFLIQKIPKSISEKSVLLTFDDGPDPEITPQVLDLLSLYEVRAIFFIPGRRISRAPSLLVKIIKQGHIIGNHTFIHANDRQPGFFSYLEDIKKCQKMIFDLCGTPPRFFRPPGGVISFTTLLASKLVGLQLMTWSLDVHDWQCKSKEDADIAAYELINTVKSGDIVLLHDDNKNILHLLKVALPALKKKGYFMHEHDYLNPIWSKMK